MIMLKKYTQLFKGQNLSWCIYYILTLCHHCVMPQSHHTPRPHMGCSRTALNKNCTSIHPMRHHTNFASLNGARSILKRASYSYGPRTGLQIVNNPWTARTGPYGHIRRTCRIFVGCVNSLTCLYWSHRIWKTLEIPMRGLYGHHTGSMWSPVIYLIKQ